MGNTAFGLANFDLLSVGIAVAGMAVLGFAVLFSDPRSISNRTFLGLALATGAWGSLNYLSYQGNAPEISFLLLRWAICFGVISAFFTFTFAYVFPAESKTYAPWYRWGVAPLSLIAAFATLTPLVFTKISGTGPDGHVTAVDVAPGVLLFALTILSLNIGAVILFVKKLVSANPEQKNAFQIILFGMLAMLTCIVMFNLVLPVFFTNTRFIPLGALFLFPFIGATAYAVLNQKLFNVKVTGTALLVFALTIVTFGEIIFSGDIAHVIYRVSVFALVLIFGISLIRGVIREVKQREQIQRLAEDLKLANERQEGLLHFVGHEVKNFLTKDLGALSELVEGSYGGLPDAAKQFASRAALEAKKGVASVSELLLASNQKKGTIAYKMESFDFGALVAEAVESLKPHAVEKGLGLEFNARGAEGSTIIGDRGQLGDHVVRNLIDNAINYTPKGAITVSLGRKPGFVILSVKDTGKGISPEDRARLFTEGGRGKDSLKYNAHSTGYGLFITKGIVEAHKGTVRAESEGEGKGSVFIVELPVS